MILKVDSISKQYGEQQVLKNISFKVNKGETIAIVGPSGSGKTTLLNLIGALDKPNNGSIIYDGTDISKMTSDEQSHFRNKNIGFVFQMHYLLPQCSVYENVLIPTLSYKDKNQKSEAEKRTLELIERVGLSDQMHKLPGQLSGGECQRTAFVRALINQPTLLLADEPTGSLDGETADVLTDLLLELNKESDTSLIVVTHSMQLAKKMDKLMHLRNNNLQIN